MLILKLLSLIDKHLQQFFDAFYIMINHKIRYYFLQTLHNLNINVNARKLNFKPWSTHSLIAFPIYEPHRRASAPYSNNLYKKTAFFFFFQSNTDTRSKNHTRNPKVHWRELSVRDVFILGKGKQKLKERILIKQGAGWFLSFASSCVFKTKYTLLDKEPSLYLEPLRCTWTIASFNDSTININLHNYIFNKTSAEQSKLNLAVIMKHTKFMVMKCEHFSGLKKKVNTWCTSKPVLTTILDSKSNEQELDWKTGFGFSFVMHLLCIR